MNFLKLFNFARMLYFLEVVFGYLIASNFVFNNVLFLVFISFTLIYNSIYVINDIIDVKEDRLHPEKKKRMIASGKISIRNAWIFSISLILIGLLLGYFISIKLLIFELVFLLINWLYTFYFKHIKYLDFIINGLTHPLRFYLGVVLAGSYDFIGITIGIFLISSAFSLLKRENEFINKQYSRKVLKYYTINQFLIIYLIIFIFLLVLLYLELNYRIIILIFTILFILLIGSFHISKKLQKKISFLIKF
ncbi:MAG: UbiA family prenyltransferase [Candidatus Nanoarchaeia archaeon]|nr:UbiA family prenyltransferase [Candidatus Nanoarchaeia archaeon]